MDSCCMKYREHEFNSEFGVTLLSLWSLHIWMRKEKTSLLFMALQSYFLFLETKGLIRQVPLPEQLSFNKFALCVLTMLWNRSVQTIFCAPCGLDGVIFSTMEDRDWANGSWLPLNASDWGPMGDSKEPFIMSELTRTGYNCVISLASVISEGYYVTQPCGSRSQKSSYHMAVNCIGRNVLYDTLSGKENNLLLIWNMR